MVPRRHCGESRTRPSVKGGVFPWGKRETALREQQRRLQQLALQHARERNLLNAQQLAPLKIAQQQAQKRAAQRHEVQQKAAQNESAQRQGRHKPSQIAGCPARSSAEGCGATTPTAAAPAATRPQEPAAGPGTPCPALVEARVPGLNPKSVADLRRSIMQADRHVQALPVVRKTGGRERRRADQSRDIVRKCVAFRWNAEQVGIELAVGIVIMDDRKRIRSRRDSFEVATRRRISNFYHHYVLRRTQKLARETGWRVEERAIYGSIAVPDVQNLHVNSGARGRLSKSGGGKKIGEHQQCEPRYTFELSAFRFPA
jgi:hypothetical protein